MVPRPGPKRLWSVPFESAGGLDGSGSGDLQICSPTACASLALTFYEPVRAKPDLAGQILRVILPEGLHKKNGSSTLSGAQVA